MIVNGLAADDNRAIKRNVFVVCADDDPIILLSFRAMLKGILPPEMEVLTATDGNQALHIIRNVSNDSHNLIVLVISDWNMPSLHGDKLFKVIHKEYPWIKLIMISAYSRKDAEKHLADVPHVYLTKPVNESILSEAINTLMVEAHLGLKQ